MLCWMRVVDLTGERAGRFREALWADTVNREFRLGRSAGSGRRFVIEVPFGGDSTPKIRKAEPGHLYFSGRSMGRAKFG